MKVDYLSEFGFRLSDYGKYSTIVLFLPPAPRPPLGGAPARLGCRCRCPRSGAERSAPCPGRPAARLVPSAAAGPGTAGRFPGTRCPGPLPRRNFSRRPGGCAGAGRRTGPRAGPSGARGRHQVLPGARSLFHFSFTCFTEVGFLSCRRSGPALPGPAEAGGEVSRGLRSAGSFPAARRPPRAGPGRGGGRAAGRGAGWPGEDAEGKFMGVLK